MSLGAKEALFTRQKLMKLENTQLVCTAESSCKNSFLKFILIYVYEYFACTYICTLCECLVLVQAKRGHQIYWNWSDDGSEPPFEWSSEEQKMLLTTELSLSL